MQKELKLVISVPEDIYNEFMKENNYEVIYNGYWVAKAIAKGTIIKEGSWIKITSPLSEDVVVKCPICGDEFIGHDVEEFKFCPECGTKMER